MRGGVTVHISEGPARRRAAVAALLVAPALGILGPLALWPLLVLHVGLPVMTAGHLVTRGSRARFVAEDRPRIADGLEWLLGLCAWASLAAAGPPWRPGPRAVRLHLPPPSAPPSARGALARLVTGLPGAAAAVLAGAAALVPWLALVVTILVTGRAPARLRRVQAHVLALQAAVVCRQAAVAQSPRKASTTYWSRVWNHDSAMRPSRMWMTCARLFSSGGRPSGRDAV